MELIFPVGNQLHRTLMSPPALPDSRGIPVFGNVHAFSQMHVKSCYPSLQTFTERFLQRLGRHVDAADLFELELDLMWYTVDVTAELTFETDMNMLETNDSFKYSILDIFIRPSN